VARTRIGDAPVTLPLVRLLTLGRSSVDIWPGDSGRLRLGVHSILREPIDVDLGNVVGFVSPLRGAAPRESDISVIDTPFVPLLRNGRVGTRNLGLVFRERVTIPQLRWAASWYTGLPKRMLELDGVVVCVKRGIPIVETLERAGLTRFDSVFDALLTCRPTTEDPETIAALEVTRSAERSARRRNSRVYLAALAAFVALRFGLVGSGVLHWSLFAAAFVILLGAVLTGRRMTRKRAARR
jgi:hypothetical protein